MIIKQKIKKLIIVFSIMLVITLTGVFHSKLNPFIINFIATRFNIITSSDNILVHYINIGQGDASAINFPDGKIMLIDTGSEEYNTTYLNYLKENVVNSQRSNYIDYLVLSHADMDHCGGAMKLFKNFRIGKVFMPKIESDSKGYQEILNYVKKNLNYQILGEEFVIKTEIYEIMFFEILNDTNTNDSSQIIKVESFDQSFLFAGDISTRVEQLYLSRYGTEFDVDVLKVAHHGSKTSSSEEFINAVSPKYSIISVGENDYGHPMPEVLEVLNKNQSTILRTDQKDSIMFAVGEIYHLYQTDGSYYITRMSLDYFEFVLFVDCFITIYAVVIFVKKDKKKIKNKFITIQLIY